jgi:hypothetical protein
MTNEKIFLGFISIVLSLINCVSSAPLISAFFKNQQTAASISAGIFLAFVLLSIGFIALDQNATIKSLRKKFFFAWGCALCTFGVGNLLMEIPSTMGLFTIGIIFIATSCDFKRLSLTK